jgi:hypothetical protein
MKSTPRFFGGAAILGAGLALKLGAPIAAVAIGVLIVAFVNWRVDKRSLSRTK